MPTPEEKYYDGMNTLLAPVRAAKSIVQTALIILLLIGIGMFYPIIQLVNEGHITLDGFMVSFMTCWFIYTFFRAPWYTVNGSILGFLGVCIFIRPLSANGAFGFGLVVVLGIPLFLLVGNLQRIVRNHIRDGGWDFCDFWAFEWKIRNSKRRILADDPVNSKCIKCRTAIIPPARFCSKCGAAQTAPSLVTWPWRAKRQKAEEEKRRELEVERQSKAADRQKREQKAKEESQRARKEFLDKHKKIFAGISDLLSSCRAPAIEIIRAASALRGDLDADIDPKMVVWTDVGCILASFGKTVGLDDAYIGKLWSELTRKIKPPDVDGVPELSTVSTFTNCGVKQLEMIDCLKEYDKRQGTAFSSRAASAYLAIVSAVATYCDGSLAAKIVADKYIELLSPNIHDSDGNGYSGNSNGSGNTSARKSVCEKCHAALELLGLPLDTSLGEVRSKRRAWAEVLHPDQMGNKSERARTAAEEQLKGINAACDQVLRCRKCH